MSGRAEVSTDRGLGLQWWHVVAAGTVVWALFIGAVDLEGSLNVGVIDAVALAALVAWPAIPLAMYLDMRAIGGKAAWEPATKSWLLVSVVWLANVGAGLAYCIRRNSALRGEVPSANWRYGVYVGFLAWIGIVAADVALDHVPLGPLEPFVFGPVLYVTLIGFPVAIYLDAEYVRAHTDLEPNLRALVALSAVPLVNIFVGAFYIGGRWWHFQKTDPAATPVLPGEAEVGAGKAEAVSPWYRRAAAVFVAYFVVVVAIGSWLSLESDLGWDLLGLVLWPPFGFAFVACVHFDLRDVRRAGVPWGDTRYLYYLSVVIPAAAFWYVLRRLAKVQRARSKGLLDDDHDGGDENGGAGGDGRRDEELDVGDEASRETDATHGPDGTEAVDGTGFEWGESSRG